MFSREVGNEQGGWVEARWDGIAYMSTQVLFLLLVLVFVFVFVFVFIFVVVVVVGCIYR